MVLELDSGLTVVGQRTVQVGTPRDRWATMGPWTVCVACIYSLIADNNDCAGL